MILRILLIIFLLNSYLCYASPKTNLLDKVPYLILMDQDNGEVLLSKNADVKNLSIIND